MLSRKRPRVSSATGTWKPRKKARTNSRSIIGSSGVRSGGWRGVPGRRGELKYVDAIGSAISITSSGVLHLLNGLVPGTGASQRIGKKAIMKTLQFRAAMGGGTTGATPFQGFVRLLWIYDKQSNATAPTVAQILEQTSGSSMMNMDNRDRFTVLADKQFALDQSGGHQSAQCKMFKRLNHATIFNNGTAGTVADITSGSIYLLVINESVNINTNDPIIYYTNRIRFDDS